MEKYIFENWKERSSQVGNLLTNLEKITPKQLEELNGLLDRQIESKSNPKKALTDNMRDKLTELIAKRDKPDSLPPGAITHLENVFRDVFWGRRRLLHNKFLDKGLLAEEDALALLSEVEGVYYAKNKESFETEYLKGTADIVTDIITDTKCNYDMESFDNAELTKLYEWQIKAYCIGYGKTKGRVAYCLVNNPEHQIRAARTNLFYGMGTPDESEVRWIEAVQQVERNHIFDIPAFKAEYPNYDFENTQLDFHIPAKMRLKIFDVELQDGDEEIINSRVKLAREWLLNKEKETLEKLKD